MLPRRRLKLVIGVIAWMLAVNGCGDDKAPTGSSAPADPFRPADLLSADPSASTDPPDAQLTADLPGVYYVQLIVHDGVIGSNIDMAAITAQALVTVPDVTGALLADAETAITTAQLGVGVVDHAHSDDAPAGSVISQTPAPGASVVIGSPVDLVVSKGVWMVTVPDVSGLPRADAETTITTAALTVGPVYTEHIDTTPAGHVIRQDPAPGLSVPHAAPVAITVSL